MLFVAVVGIVSLLYARWAMVRASLLVAVIAANPVISQPAVIIPVVPFSLAAAIAAIPITVAHGIPVVPIEAPIAVIETVARIGRADMLAADITRSLATGDSIAAIPTFVAANVIATTRPASRRNIGRR